MNDDAEILFSWIKQLIQPEADTSWLQQCVDAIAYRGGPRNEIDEAYLKLARSNVDLAALTLIIHRYQMFVAKGFFGIHSGAYDFRSDEVPDIRFTIHSGRSGPDSETVDSKELPNAIDEGFLDYMQAR